LHMLTRDFGRKSNRHNVDLYAVEPRKRDHSRHFDDLAVVARNRFD
jgi:hypothetical protein